MSAIKIHWSHASQKQKLTFNNLSNLSVYTSCEYLPVCLLIKNHSYSEVT